ncbi:MAG: hypothetical protein VCA55_13315 [Verrucomicrobiales bacterium]
MLLDQFWKIIFVILLCAGFIFWYKYRSGKKNQTLLIDELAELITAEEKTASPIAEKKIRKRFYKSIDILRQIEENMGDKFEINAVISRAIESSGLSGKFPEDAVADTFELNYQQAKGFGLLDDDDAISRLEQGLTPKIKDGHWAGETAEVGYHIIPSINTSIENHIANRVLLPSSIKELMKLEDFSRRVKSQADRFRRAKILDQGSYDVIDNTHKARVARSKS